MIKVIVLGGFGFLGNHVNEELSKKGYIAVPLSRRNGCDITKLQSFKKILKKEKPDAIINCAAHVGSVHYAMANSADMIYDNIKIIANLYKAVKEVCPEAKIVNPISNCTYPGNADNHFEPDWQNGPVHDSVIAYASARRLLHAVSFSFNKQFNVKSINWLIANAYGPGDYSDPNKVHALNGILIRLIKAKRNNEKTFEIWGSGTPLREWVFIKDVAKTLVASLNLNEQIYPLNLAQNKAYSIKDIAQIGADLLDYKVDFVFNKKFPDGAMIKILDDINFRSQYPHFKFTPLQKGINETISYYKKIL